MQDAGGPGLSEVSQRMARSREPGSELAAVSLAAEPELGDRLKVMFGEMSSGPMPPRLLELADRLEEAFQRGELFSGCTRRAS